jgi:hypothetical protein
MLPSGFFPKKKHLARTLLLHMYSEKLYKSAVPGFEHVAEGSISGVFSSRSSRFDPAPLLRDARDRQERGQALPVPQVLAQGGVGGLYRGPCLIQIASKSAFSRIAWHWTRKLKC